MSINLQTALFAQTVRPGAVSGFPRDKDVERA
jgi:hypothetical protein